MHRKINVLQAGPISVHLENFCRGILPHINGFDFIGEESASFPGLRQQLICSFRGKNPAKWLWNYFRIKNFIRKTKPDVIHVHQANRLAYMVTGAASALNIPVITTAWGSDVLLIPERNSVFRNITKRILKHSTIITGDSLEMIDAMKQIFPSGNYTWIQYGIDPVNEAPKEKIIYSNRLHETNYQIDTIIREFAVFASNHPEYTLVIGATGSKTDALKELTASLQLENRVEFAGWLNRAKNHHQYARASMYVSIPLSDGTSVSLLEAMSAGCIPVVSNIPVSKEWIIDGENGIIYQPGQNPFERALKINQAKCKQINSEKIRQHALRTATSRQFYDLYQEAIRINRQL